MDEKCTLSLSNENVGKHKAILTIVHALKHGKSINDIITECSFGELSDSRQSEWSKALVNLSNEICILKQIEMVTASSDCDNLETTSIADCLKLFLTMVENTSTTVDEVFTLLHPDTLTDVTSFDTVRSLPTCCDGERNLLVRCSFILMIY